MLGALVKILVGLFVLVIKLGVDVGCDEGSECIVGDDVGCEVGIEVTVTVGAKLGETIGKVGPDIGLIETVELGTKLRVCEGSYVAIIEVGAIEGILLNEGNKELVAVGSLVGDVDCMDG